GSTGCSDTAQVTISEGDSVLANASANKDSVNLSVDSTVNFSSSGSIGNNYTWDFDDGDSSNFQNPSHNYGSIGTYQIVLTVTNNTCMDKDTVTVVVDKNTGISSRALNIDLNIYPNPTKGQVTLSIAMKRPEDVDVSVLNVLGDEVLSKSIEDVKKEKIKLDLQNHSAGFYMLKIRMGDKIMSRKLQLMSR
ncbi:MAG: T9SS type A sorting domain-containing protein, partial [Flavobacteriales bacterium]